MSPMVRRVPALALAWGVRAGVALALALTACARSGTSSLPSC